MEPQQETLYAERAPEPWWRNGIRARLKIAFPQGIEGSSPSHGTTHSMKTLWFRAKRYGYGWTPASWQGWLALLLYVIAVVATFRSIDVHSHSVSDTLIGFVPLWILYSFLLVLLCSLTGEKATWRRGK